MSKLQKWCLGYIQVCTLAKPCGCLYTVRRGTPHVCPPPGAQFLREYQALPPRYWFCLSTSYYRGCSPKAMRHENACLLRGQNLEYQGHC